VKIQKRGNEATIEPVKEIKERDIGIEFVNKAVNRKVP
jgi:hypothetical protein